MMECRSGAEEEAIETIEVSLLTSSLGADQVLKKKRLKLHDTFVRVVDWRADQVLKKKRLKLRPIAPVRPSRCRSGAEEEAIETAVAGRSRNTLRADQVLKKKRLKLRAGGNNAPGRCRSGAEEEAIETKAARASSVKCVQIRC